MQKRFCLKINRWGMKVFVPILISLYRNILSKVCETYFGLRD